MEWKIYSNSLRFSLKYDLGAIPTTNIHIFKCHLLIISSLAIEMLSSPTLFKGVGYPFYEMEPDGMYPSPRNHPVECHCLVLAIPSHLHLDVPLAIQCRVAVPPLLLVFYHAPLSNFPSCTCSWPSLEFSSPLLSYVARGFFFVGDYSH
jgi:hypothetical protein